MASPRAAHRGGRPVGCVGKPIVSATASRFWRQQGAAPKCRGALDGVGTQQAPKKAAVFFFGEAAQTPLQPNPTSVGTPRV